MAHSIALLSNSAIVIQIFTLICNKLDLNLTKHSNINHITNSYDIIVVDEDFIDMGISPLKQKCKLFGAIINDNSFEMLLDFEINRPFLPSDLQKTLSEIIEKLKTQNEQKVKEATIEIPAAQLQKEKEKELAQFNIPEKSANTHIVEEIVSSIDEQLDNIKNDIVVPASKIEQDGGVLDVSELQRIEKLLDETIDDNLQTIKKMQEEQINNQDLTNLSEIIDKTINEIKIIDNFEQNVIILSHYDLEEVRPFLKKVNQEIIDNLADGKEVTLNLKLKEEENDKQ